MKRNALLTCLALALFALAITYPKTVAVSVEASPPAPPENVTSVPLYWFTESKQYVDPISIAFHFYTIVEDEKAALQTQPQWSYRGIIGYVFAKQVPGTTPLYRLVKNEYGRVNHFMTIDKAELDSVVNSDSGWQSEGVCCYVSPKQVAGTAQLYRLYLPERSNKPTLVSGLLGDDTEYLGDVHFYTTDGPTKYTYIYHGFQPSPMVMYIWTQPTDASAVKPLVAILAPGSASSGSKGGNVIKAPAGGGPAPSAQQQLFTLGCVQNAGKKTITCPTIQGVELCNYYKKKGELNVTYCTTTADQFKYDVIEKDLTAQGCSNFLGRAGEYLCQTLKGAQACRDYMKKGDGLVTRCLSVKDAEMNQDLKKHGCYDFLGREGDYMCPTADGFKTCENYRIDGRLKVCRQPTKK
jgi:hypothetical protein